MRRIERSAHTVASKRAGHIALHTAFDRRALEVQTMATLGPVEYVVVSFPGNKFRGEIVGALGELVDADIIRILDLAFVKKDADGNVLKFEYDGLDELARFADLEGEADGIFSDQDLDDIGQQLDLDSSAALLLWEDRWACRFARAVQDAGGIIQAGGRIPRATIEHALARLSPK
jgi:hypothetical protein